MLFYMEFLGIFTSFTCLLVPDEDSNIKTPTGPSIEPHRDTDKYIG